jgi:integrase
MIRKRGSRYQVLVYDVATGRKRSVGTRGTWREARQLEAANVRDRPSDKAPLVREFAALWFDVYSRPEPTTNRHNRQMVKPFLATFGDRPLDTIGRAEAKAWAQRHPHAAKVGAALFNDAIDAEAASSNPFARLGLARGRGRQDAIPLTEEQVQRLADCSLTALDRFYGPTVRAMILFHAYTGLRSGELCGVEWRDLTGDELVVARQVRPDGSLALPKTKRIRRIVVPPIALDAVGTVPQQYDWIFPSARGKRMARGSHLYAFNQVKQAAGLPRITPYDLRHFCGSLLADRGLQARDIAEQLGNSAEVCERVYVHAYEDRTRDRLRIAFGGTSADQAKEALG